MWHTYVQPTSLEEALRLLHEHAGLAGRARIVAGGTDVLVELSRGVRPAGTLIDVSRLHALKAIWAQDGAIHLGALATHNDVIASALCVECALPLAQACREVGAPQIRTRATVAGNLVTASPANDTITPLLALDATVVLASLDGERHVPLRDLYRGVRRTDIRPDELVREIRVPAMSPQERGLFLKLGLRRAQAIAVINVALVLRFTGDSVADARIALGCLAPTVIRATTAEAYLKGQRLDAATCAEAGRLACQDVAPIDDVRGSADYRRATLAALVADGLQRLAAGTERDGWAEQPVLLDTSPFVTHYSPLTTRFDGTTIATTINGRLYRLTGAAGKTLLDALREDAGLTGTKEGCAEGECGACTVWLDGQAAMSCLVPAPQAHGATLTTIEGLAGIAMATDGADRGDNGANRGDNGAAGGERLHPLQAAFIAHGAVQCGYCIPGMLMAGAKLLQEQPAPDLDAVRAALSGNICRCTGYRKILDAVIAAGGER